MKYKSKVENPLEVLNNLSLPDMNNYCNGDKHMGIYINPDGSIVDGIQRFISAIRSNKEIRINYLEETTTKEQVEEYLNNLPKDCSCGNR